LTVNKQALIQKIVEKLTADLALYFIYIYFIYIYIRRNRAKPNQIPASTLRITIPPITAVFAFD